MFSLSAVSRTEIDLALVGTIASVAAFLATAAVLFYTGSKIEAGITLAMGGITLLLVFGWRTIRGWASEDRRRGYVIASERMALKFDSADGRDAWVERSLLIRARREGLREIVYSDIHNTGTAHSFKSDDHDVAHANYGSAWPVTVTYPSAFSRTKPAECKLAYRLANAFRGCSEPGQQDMRVGFTRGLEKAVDEFILEILFEHAKPVRGSFHVEDLHKERTLMIYDSLLAARKQLGNDELALIARHDGSLYEILVVCARHGTHLAVSWNWEPARRERELV